MSPDLPAPLGSVSRWLGPLRAGDDEARQAFWEECRHRLVEHARRRLEGVPLGADGEEDVALSAFDSFRLAAEAGRFPDLVNRADLWQILLTITTRKCANLANHENADKRGGGWVRTEIDPAHIPAPGPTPEFCVELADLISHLFSLLKGDRSLELVARLLLDGRGNKEIAAELGRSVVTVRRKRESIRILWQREVPDERREQS